MIIADALAFLGPQGQPPIANPNLELNLAHVTSSPPWVRTTDEILEHHSNFRQIIKKQQTFLQETFASGLKDVPQDKTAIVYGLQGAPEDADLVRMYKLKTQGLSVVGLAYQEKNRYGSGFLNPQVPLSEMGKRYLEWCANAGLILDLAHAGHQTASDALNFIQQSKLKLKVFVSHTGVYGEYDCYNPRNLPMEILQEVSKMGGVVGIYALTFGLSTWNDTLVPFMEHLMAAFNSACKVALGSDAVYQARDIEIWKVNFQMMKEKIDPRGLLMTRWPDQPRVLNKPNLMTEINSLLRNHGIPEQACADIMGGNLLEFFSK